MARRAASKRDISEFGSGKASTSDKREMGFVKTGGRLIPGRSTPRKISAAFGRRRGAATKKRVVRKRGRASN